MLGASLFILSLNITAQSKKQEVLSSFCQPTIPDALFQSNVSFSEGYTFKIDANGKPIIIKKFMGSYLNDDEVISCISNWKFFGFAENTRFSAYFDWKHGVGWLRMRISSKDFLQTIILGDNDCFKVK